MANIGRFLEILSCARQVLESYGPHPSAEDAGYVTAQDIYDRAFLELVMEGFPATEDGNFWVIETDGETYVLDTTRYGGTSVDEDGGTDGSADEDDEQAEDIEEAPDTGTPAPRAVLNADGLYEAPDRAASSDTPAPASTRQAAEQTETTPGSRTPADRGHAASRTEDGYTASAGTPAFPDGTKGAANGAKAAQDITPAAPAGQTEAGRAPKGNGAESRRSPQTIKEALTDAYGAAGNGEPSFAEPAGDVFDMDADIPAPLDMGAAEPAMSGLDKVDEEADLSKFDAGDGMAEPADADGRAEAAAEARTETKTENKTETKTEAKTEAKTETENAKAAAGTRAGAGAGQTSSPADTDNGRHETGQRADRSDAGLMPSRMEKNGFLFCEGAYVINDPSSQNARDGFHIIASPIRLGEGPVPFILCVIAGRTMHTMASDGTHAVAFRSGTHAVTARMELQGTDCRMDLSLDPEDEARGARLTGRVRSHGTRGHIVLTDRTGNLRVHLFPASFANNSRGTASFLYYVTDTQDPDGTPVTGTSNGREHVVFHWRDTDYEIRAAWKDGILYGKVV